MFRVFSRSDFRGRFLLRAESEAPPQPQAPATERAAEISPEPELRWFRPHSSDLPQGPTSGRWDLIWQDGVCVELHRVEGKWSATQPMTLPSSWDDSPSLDTVCQMYEPAALPPKAQCRTRRELVQILTEWRRRELELQGRRAS